MTDTATSKKSGIPASPHPFWVLAAVYGLLGPVAAFAKMGTVPLVLITLFCHVSFKHVFVSIRQFIISPIGLSLSALFLWSAVTFFWSESPKVLSLLRLFSVVLAAVLVTNAIEGLDIGDKRRLSRIVLGALTFLLMVLLFEGASGAALHSIIRPEDAAPRKGEWVPNLQMVAARGTAILAPFCFIGAALIFQISGKIYNSLLFAALAFAATLQLPMAASTLAIGCGSAAFLFVHWKARIATRLVFAATIIFAFLSPFLMSSLLTRNMFENMGIEVTRGQTQRLAIWENASELILKKPFLGYGFDASRDIGSRGEIVSGTNWPVLPLHPHNAFLQIWLELGFVGVCLINLLIWQIWQIFETKIKNDQDIAVLMATFVATLTISLVSFGVWQYWWIATWGLLAGTCRLLVPGERYSQNNSVAHQTN